LSFCSAWTFGKLASKIIADAVAAAESASGQGALPAAEIPSEMPESVDFIAQAQAYNHALLWLDKQNPAPLGAPIECNGGCTCAAKYGVIGHAAFCPLGAAGEKA